MIVFDKHWFRDNQRAILQAVNSPLIGGLIRRNLWIEDKEKIVKITPNSVHVLHGGQVKATFYSNNQYAEAFRKNFKLIWEVFHFWDMQFANKLAPSLNVGFDTYTSQPDEASGVDGAMNSAAANTNYDAYIIIGNLGSETTRSLIKFDLTSIPSSALPSSATLSIWYDTDYAANSRTLRATRVLRDWVEAQMTWNNWKTGNAWSVAGCGSDGNDYDSTEHATASMSASASAGTELQFSFGATGLTELKKMYDGTYTNYGWRLKADTETDDLWYYRSSSYGTAGQRPKLVIVYSTGSFVPFTVMY